MARAMLGSYEIAWSRWPSRFASPVGWRMSEVEQSEKGRPRPCNERGQPEDRGPQEVEAGIPKGESGGPKRCLCVSV